MNWRLLRLKNVVTIYHGKDYKDIETNDGIPVVGSGGQFAYASKSMYDGEVIFLGRKGTIDRPLYYNGEFWAVDTMFYAVPNKNALGKFIYYCATLFPFKKYSTATALPSMTQTSLYQIPFLLPSIGEQQRIVDYLDKKLAAKKSVIHQAVTRGLNPNVTLKDSDIDWIGLIPEHWEIKRFKDVFRKYTTGLTPESKIGENFSDDKRFTWVTIGDMTSRVIFESAMSLSEKVVIEKQPVISPKGSLLFSFKLSIGKTAFAGKDLYTNEAIVSIPPTKYADLNYFYYTLPSVCYNNATENIYGAKMLNQKIIANMLMIFPPLSEQQAIADYLDEKCAKIDAAIENITKQIEASKRLKKAIINEAICGYKF